MGTAAHLDVKEKVKSFPYQDSNPVAQSLSLILILKGKSFILNRNCVRQSLVLLWDE